jgi:hypothetical protein
MQRLKLLRYVETTLNAVTGNDMILECNIFSPIFFFSCLTQSVSLSLAERKKLQRAQQLRFLKEQGLIKNEQDVKGGAGSDAGSVSSKRRKPRVEKV